MGISPFFFSLFFILQTLKTAIIVLLCYQATITIV